jgi:hypothetical protein
MLQVNKDVMPSMPLRMTLKLTLRSIYRQWNMKGERSPKKQEACLYPEEDGGESEINRERLESAFVKQKILTYRI